MSKRVLGIIAFVFLFSNLAQAATAKNQISATLGAFSSAAFLTGTNPSDVAADQSTLMSGFMSIGAEYTYRMKKSMGISAFAKYLSTSDQLAVGEVDVSFMNIGGLWRHYLRAGKTEFSLGAGLAFVSPSITTNAVELTLSSTFAAVFSVQALYQMSDSMQFGIEMMETTLMGSEANGSITEWLLKGTFEI